AFLPVNSGPVTIHRGAEAEFFVDHQLAAVSVPGQNERQFRVGRRIESVGMVGEQNREGFRISRLEKFSQRRGNRILGIAVGMLDRRRWTAPTESENLDRSIRDS